MKIPGANDSNPKKPIADVTSQPAGARVGLLRHTLGGTDEQTADSATTGVETRGDSVQVSSLANALRSHLDPASLADERSEKVKRLKDLIRSGQYNPKSEDVARAVSEELSIEILLGSAGERSDDESLI
jgi:flagellar biosynthesis anti-sigma factor FlgM